MSYHDENSYVAESFIATQSMLSNIEEKTK